MHIQRCARTLLACASLLVIPTGPTATGANDAGGPPVHKLELVSKRHEIDRVYRSMEGPTDTQFFRLIDSEEPELIWLTATTLEILDGEGNAVSDEYLCHSNLYFSEFKKHHLLFDRTISPDSKFVDINQGLMEVRFPPDFGFPLISNEMLHFHSMVINPVYDGDPFEIKVRTTFEYVRDRDLQRPMIPLSQRGIPLRIPIGNYDERQQPIADPRACAPDHETHAEHAAHTGHDHGGETLADSATHRVFQLEEGGPVHSMHWFVPPGRHVYRHRMAEGLAIPFRETTVHVVTGHMHPYGTSLELIDVTAGRTLVELAARNYPDRVGLAVFDSYSSVEGFKVYSDHAYELVATYDNTTDHDVDAMAVIYVYFADVMFDKNRINLQADSSEFSVAPGSDQRPARHPH